MGKSSRRGDLAWRSRIDGYFSAGGGVFLLKEDSDIILLETGDRVLVESGSSAKVSALTAETNPDSADLLMMVDDPGGLATTQKITLGNAGLGLKATILHDEVLGGSQASFTINITGSPIWVEINLVARTSYNNPGDEIEAYFNGDTTRTNYRMAWINCGTALASGAADYPDAAESAALTTTANIFGVANIRIPSPTIAGFFKMLVGKSFVYHTLDSTIYTYNYYSTWENTAAITSVVLQSYNGEQFDAGSWCRAIGYEAI